MGKFAGVLAVVLMVSAVYSAPLQLSIGAWPTDMVLTIRAADGKAQLQSDWVLYLAAGNEAVRFCWLPLEVDPKSIVLRLPEGLSLSGTSLGPEAEKWVEWRLEVPEAGFYEVSISFCVAGLKWRAHYDCLLSDDWTTATLGCEVVLTNQTGLALENVPTIFDTQPSSSALQKLTGEQIPGQPPGLGFKLSEVTLPMDWQRRWPLFTVAELPVSVVNHWDCERQGDGVQKVLYIDTTGVALFHQQQPPAGRVDFYAPEADGLRHIGHLDVPSPLPESIALTLGPEPDLIVERVMTDYDKTAIERNRAGEITGFDIIEKYEITVINSTGQEQALELRETMLSTWDLSAEPVPAELDETYALFKPTLGPGRTLLIKLEFIKHSGTRAE